MKQIALLLACCLFAPALPAAEAEVPGKLSRGDQMLSDYFRAETALLADGCLADINTLADWKSRRDEYRRQLQEMLGLWPMPERTELRPVITGKLEQDDFTVEKLHFQASPGLYVTANLYLPKTIARPAPAILYVCGHSRQVKDGISFGNKAGYHHHGVWFARNGYVCLIIDTLQLGEIEALHHGTHRFGMWWWNSRGYTPAGVNAWFGIRALDYLCSRPEVDKERIGMTGRSGGGSYTWTVAALDDRVKVAVPVAGITDMQNQVVDGCVERHCDCMFYVNTYRWDFPMVAALIAPRPLLLSNSDKDQIFPLEGVVRLHEKARRVYQLYGQSGHLGLLITEGGHQDTQDLHVPAFRWFNRFLKNDDSHIEMAAKKILAPEQLRVFEQLPADAVNTNIQSTFGPAAATLTPATAREQRAALLAALKEKSFAGWPADGASLDATLAFVSERGGVKLSAWDFASQQHVSLRLYLLERASGTRPKTVSLRLLDEPGWVHWVSALRAGFESELENELTLAKLPASDGPAFADWKRELSSGEAALAFFAPRGIGLSAWTGDDRKRTHIRRRFMLLGQTLDGMRVWDIRRAVQAVHFVRESDSAQIELRAHGSMAVNALYAALFEPGVRRLQLDALRGSHLGSPDVPDYLNVLSVLDIPHALELVSGSVETSARP